MWLTNLRLPGEGTATDILVEGQSIVEMRSRAKGSPQGLSFDGALVFPGLINSHDHLDFNLFPALANRIYTNYRDWGVDIHTVNKGAINAVLQIPLHLRVMWGMYKNLLNGFTTVVNHGERLPIPSGLISIFQDCHCLHSVGFEKNWRWKLNRPLRDNHPFVLHAGEGTDALAGEEIGQLLRWNIFGRPLVGVHGVAMTEQQAEGFRALVWCPSSNYFLLDRTAPVGRLKEKVSILFGTDSTLTADWNSWQQIRQARRERAMTDQELFSTLTSTPAAVWGLGDRGQLAPGKTADLVIAKSGEGLSGMDAFYGLDPEDLLLVLHQGRILLFDVSIRDILMAAGMGDLDFDFTRCGQKYIVGDVPGLMAEIRRYYPAVRFPEMLGN
ncbi:amidohydrolase family protein [Puia sp.]|jgi:cytosine/adenosine deaminase-related metal-dependent hydrolase|uniref:amidohydrolase family protein n=1 Tax=Puia sp. TaxID=2045100 RepID=UPI002F41BE19